MLKSYLCHTAPENTIQDERNQRQGLKNETNGETFNIALPQGSTGHEIPQIQVKENRSAIVAAFFLFSYIGVLIRIGLNKWHTYEGQPVSLAVFPQFVGCMIMGYLYDDKNRIES